MWRAAYALIIATEASTGLLVALLRSTILLLRIVRTGFPAAL